MKKLTALSLLVFWAAVTALLTSGLVIYQNDRQPIATQDQQGATTTASTAKTLSMQEIATHNSTASCWLLIEGKVYDVTSFLYQHPGEASTIIPTCGTDATKAYATMGRTNSPRPHSQNANAMLQAYYIGDLGQVAASVQKPTAQQPTQQTPTTPSTKPSAPTTPAQKTTLTPQGIAAHNTTSNCWMIVNGNVYDVTSYIPRHPGGAGAIKPYCGKDGTAAFEGLPHSMNAHQLLASYLVGAVGAQVTNPTNQTTTPTTSTPQPRNNDDDDD